MSKHATSEKASVSRLPVQKGDEVTNFFETFPKMIESLMSSTLRPWSMNDFSTLLPAPIEKFLSLPRVEMNENGNDVSVTVELPGVEEKDINIELRGDYLEVRGEKREEKTEEGKNRSYSERRFGSFERSVLLPCEVDKDKVDATFKNGLLRVVLPKTAKAKEQAKKISIKH